MKKIIVALPILLCALQIYSYGVSEKVVAELDAQVVVLYTRDKGVHRIVCKGDANGKLLRLAESHAFSEQGGALIFVNKTERGDIKLKVNKISHKTVILAGEPVAVSEVLQHCGIKLDDFLNDIGK